MKCLLLILFVCTALSGQITRNPPVYNPYAQVASYLGLTDAQLTAITANNNDYQSVSDAKQRRMAQVNQEIAELTAASPLDPLGLGLRYAELETICRQMKDKANEVSTKNRELLTDAQKAKMNALEAAVKLVPIYNEAERAGLIEGYAPQGFASFLLGGIAPGIILPAQRLDRSSCGSVTGAVFLNPLSAYSPASMKW